MEHIRFDPRDSRCKQPFGALRSDQSARLRVEVDPAIGAAEVLLWLREDSGGPFCVPLQLLEEPCDDGWKTFAGTVFPLPAGLYWYWFEACGGPRPFSLGGDAPYQLTVYDRAYDTPDWFDGGVVYHIFVDRFFRVGPAPVAREKRPFKLHRDWYEVPDLYPRTLKEQNYDFFGGNLRGITARLDYLESLGVTTLYLSPFFESFSNHRYDTGDYLKVDPTAGTNQDFADLCAAAAQRGMAVVLDGVFNHTGSDSLYFNDAGRYDSAGAAQSPDSPYANWYTFRHWPDDYECWWGVPSLPQVREGDLGYRAFMLGEEGVLRHWLRLGAAGYRLDVADELPGDFLQALRAAVRAQKPDALLVGEVWEDASSKVSYGNRRRYLLGAELDGVTNYPAKDAILGFVLGQCSAQDFAARLMTLHENYPSPARRCLMNILGTHDTARVRTVLGSDAADFALPKEEKACHTLTREQRHRADERLRIASALQYALPGAPCVYYGDEAGLEGFEDPLNRRGFPWGREDEELLAWYRALGALRKEYRDIFSQGEMAIAPYGGAAVLTRRLGRCMLWFAANPSEQPVDIPASPGRVLLGGMAQHNGVGTLPPCSITICYKEDSHG